MSQPSPAAAGPTSPPSFGYAFPAVVGIWLLGLMFGSHVVWRIPLLILLCSILVVETVAYFLLRSVVKLIEMLSTTRLFSRQSLQRRMHAAGSFQEWARWAAQLDRLENREEWKAKEKDPAFHPRVLRAAVAKVRAAREAGDAALLMQHLRLCLTKNFGGSMNAEMYIKTHVGTKHLIEEFVQEVEAGIAWVAEAVASAELADMIPVCADFVHDAGSAFGTSCLFLSGGAAFGFYHFGVVRGMLAEGLLPNLVCGTSMGSLVAAFLAARNDEEALSELTSLEDLYGHVGAEGGPMQGSKLERLRRLLRRGYMYEHEEMLTLLDWFTKGLTFAEAHTRTGRVVSITCTPEKTAAVSRLPPLLLNHRSAPNVTMSSAVLASSCVPGLWPAVRLQEKVRGVVQPWRDMAWARQEELPGKSCRRRAPHDFRPEDTLEEVQMRDGSFESDVPIEAMRSLFNTQFSVVSQVNPHIIPFFFHGSGAPGRPIRWPWRHYRGGFLVHLLELWLKEDMVKNCVILQKTGLLFNVFGVDWSYVFTQQDFGEVTIVPNAVWSDYWHAMDNIPSRSELERVVRASERNVWRNFTQLQARMRLQRALWRLGQVLLAASEQAAPSDRDAVLRRCGPVHAEAFRVRGASRAGTGPLSRKPTRSSAAAAAVGRL